MNLSPSPVHNPVDISRTLAANAARSMVSGPAISERPDPVDGMTITEAIAAYIGDTPMTDTERLDFLIETGAEVRQLDDGKYFARFPRLGRVGGHVRDTARAAIDAAIHEEHCARLP